MTTEFTLNDELMGKINSFARKALTTDEIYTFPVILCDNEIDRDNERFSVPALKRLSELFVGKTGIFDHDPRGENQTARIFDTEIIEDASRKTEAGEIYTAVVGKAYMIRTSKNADLIAEIDGGIKKEVSVGCSIAVRRCSVCGEDRGKKSCQHINGRRYGGKLCHTVLCEPTDAYEWSFVAVPAQINAGVSKALQGGQASVSDAERLELSQLRDRLIAEVLKCSYIIEPIIPMADIKAVAEILPTERLLSLKNSLTDMARKKLSQSPVITQQGGTENADTNRQFRL